MLPTTNRLILIAACCVLAAFASHLQAEDKYKWGKISEAEWALQPPAEYPHTPAVVIFDIGSLEVGFKGAKMERHTRHKVFDRLAASKIINIELAVPKVNDFGGFSAQTYLPNGKKFSHSSMKLLKKKISDAIEIISFSFPAVEDGCIIELKYSITSSLAQDLPAWKFQNDFYTLESQFSFTPSPYFIFNTVMIGLDDTLQTPEGVDSRLDRRPTKRFTWAMQNLPPLVEEPFQGAKLNFQPSMYFQTSGFKAEYLFGYKLEEKIELSFLKDWPDQARSLTRIYDESLVLDDTIRALVDSVLSGDSLQIGEQVKRLHAFVRDEIVTTVGVPMYIQPSQSTAETLHRRAGTAIDKNLLLVAMLQSSKYDANPLLIATRDYARFTTRILNANQFNYLLCDMKVGSTHYLLDTSTKDFPFPYLPPNLRADGGLVLTGDRLHRFAELAESGSVSETPVDTIQLNHAQWKSGIRNDAALWIDEDGSAICTSYVTISGYQQQMLGPDHGADPNSKLVSEILAALRQKNFELVEVNRIEPEYSDSTSFSIVVKITDFCTMSGGLLACQPALIWSGENYFTSPTRQFPVDLSYSCFFSESLVLHLPANYKLANLPSNVSQVTPDLLYSRAVLHDESTARVMTNLMLKRVFYPPEEYSLIHDFYQKATSSMNESLTATAH